MSRSRADIFFSQLPDMSRQANGDGTVLAPLSEYINQEAGKGWQLRHITAELKPGSTLVLHTLVFVKDGVA